MRHLLLEAQREELALEFLSKLLKNSPFANRVYLCGGAVRDAVMGKDVKDIDLVVAEPDGGIKFAEWLTKKLGIHKPGANPVTFPRFGTAKLNLRGVKVGGVDLSDLDIEVVMTRGEEYTPGSRKPEVAYADLAKDAERRDFTVNALYKDLTTGETLDPTGKGFDDIQRGVIRTPTDPNITFKDDPLRMLRAIRFACKYNWKMPKSLVTALSENAHMLQHISSERIQDEFNKMLMTARV
jgi:poly(A) polymerase